MQSHRLRLNFALSGTPSGSVTQLRQFGGYYAYGNALGGGIVNSFNVRQFLNDPKNQVIIDDFTAYLASHTTEKEFVQIVGSNEQLSTIFNEFYETTVMQAGTTPASVVNDSLVNTATIQHHDLDHAWNGLSPAGGLQNIPMSVNGGDRLYDPLQTTSQFSTEMSYYIPVFISRSYEQNSKDRYDECPNIFNQLLDPGMFDVVDTTIEGESGRIDGAVNVRSGDPYPVSNGFDIDRFNETANGLVAKCYGAECMDDRYCDFLFNGKLLLDQANVNDTSDIQDALGDSSEDFTEMDVLRVMVDRLARNGYPVVKQLYNCLFVKTPTQGPRTFTSSPTNNGTK